MLVTVNKFLAGKLPHCRDLLELSCRVVQNANQTMERCRDQETVREARQAIQEYLREIQEVLKQK